MLERPLRSFFAALLVTGIAAGTGQGARDGVKNVRPAGKKGSGVPFIPSHLLYAYLLAIPNWIGAIAVVDGRNRVYLHKDLLGNRHTVVNTAVPEGMQVTRSIDLQAPVREITGFEWNGELSRHKQRLETSAKRLKVVPKTAIGLSKKDAKIVAKWKQESQDAKTFVGQLASVVQTVKAISDLYSVYHLGDAKVDDTYFPIFGSRSSGLGVVPYGDKTALVAPGRVDGREPNTLYVIDQLSREN